MPQDLSGIVINEIFPTSTGAPSEFVELFNISGSAVDVSGWTVRVSTGRGAGTEVFEFPAGTIIQPGDGFLVDGLALPDGSGAVILTDGGGLGGGVIAATYNGGNVPGAVDSDDFGTSTPGESLEREDPNSDDISSVVPTPECFVTGTLILTQAGNVPVENLKAGDLVQTAQGDLVAVKWIGTQAVDPNAPVHPFRVLPMQVKAGALGAGLPARDLYVSPDHALLVDGLLVNAGALENGVTILQTQPEESFTYYHVELEKHSLLVAEGTYAESYLPQNQARDTFDNGDEYREGPSQLLPMSFPRVSSKRQLPSVVKARLDKVAEAAYGQLVAV